MILCVGLTCLDMISVVDGYPVEDSDQRCQEHYWQRGGNASNICTVLSRLHAPCSYMGTLANSAQTRFIEEDFKSHNIQYDTCVYHSDVTTPLAMVLSNRLNGSRTIIAPPRSLPELTASEFKQKIDLKAMAKYSWIHFEGRPNVTEIIEMLRHVDAYNAQVSSPDQRITTSVEVEKVRPKIDLIVNKADYIFIGKDFAKQKGQNSMQASVAYFSGLIREGASVICPWGDKGAMASTSQGHTEVASAMSSIQVVDTLGAGDTFNAATILALSQGASMDKALQAGCFIAGMKCTMKGFEELREHKLKYEDILSGSLAANGSTTKGLTNGSTHHNGVHTNGIVQNGMYSSENGICETRHCDGEVIQ